MSARIATAPSSAAATPLAKPTAATTATGTEGSQAAPAARGAPGSSNGTGAEGGSNTDFFSALIAAAHSDGPATPGADGGSLDRARDGKDDEAGSSDPSQSTDAASSSTTGMANTAAATSYITPTSTPDGTRSGLATDARGANRFLRSRDPNDAAAASPDAVTAAILAMANAIPGAAALLAAHAPTAGSSAPGDAGRAVAGSSGAAGQAAVGATFTLSAEDAFTPPLQRLGGAGITNLIGSDHEAVNVGDDSRDAPASTAASPANLSDLMRILPQTANPVGPPDNTIAPPVGSDGWPRAMAAQLHWFVSNGVQSATLRLVPDHLGPIDVHVDVQQSQVNVNFNAAHPDTRAALEQSVPRLREILAGSGLTLGQTNVQQQPQPRAQTPTGAARAALAAGHATDPVAASAPRLLGLVDEYV
jgi:flagellar hook-length control protein FliK